MLDFRGGSRKDIWLPNHPDGTSDLTINLNFWCDGSTEIMMMEASHHDYDQTISRKIPEEGGSSVHS